MQDWMEVALRTLIAVVILFAMTKLLGKRQISQLSFFEYITGITIGSLAAYVSLDLDARWYLGIVSLIVWVGVSLAIEYLQLQSKAIRNFIDSNSTVMIKDGKILEDNLKKERITADELLEQLRSKNAFRVADVEFAVLEPTGELNVLLTKENQPLTPKSLGIRVAPEQEPQSVIMDGTILDEPLATIGLSRDWLHAELDKMGVSLANVFLAQVDAYGQLFVDLYDDQLKVPQPQVKAALYATLKKCEADLEMFALSVDSGEAKAMYAKCADLMQKVIARTKPYLIR